jgi:two-component system sensor histidine kinase RegB
MSSPSPEVRHLVAWLQPVRWITSGTLWAVLTLTWLLPALDLSLRAVGLFALPAAICRSLVALTWQWRRAFSRPMFGFALACDALLLTGLLDITGGPFNPFIVMYVAYVWTAVLVLSPAWTALVGLVSLVGFGWLVIDHMQAGLLEHHRLNDFPTHLFTMWFASAGVAELVAHYVARARATLALQQAQVSEARERAARSERLASLTTLAAGAAHELSTPLATIAVAARELERNAGRIGDSNAASVALQDDARLIRAELDRCQAILDGMSGRAGTGAPTTLEPLQPRDIARLVLERLPDARRQRVDIEIAANAPTPSATGAEMVQAISSLLKNAFDASGRDDRVALRFTAHQGMACIEVRDGGAGMADETRRRAGEPFFSTKEPGAGLGLGLFLVRTFA